MGEPEAGASLRVRPRVRRVPVRCCGRVWMRRPGRSCLRAVLVERVGWCADLVAGMVGGLLAERWNAADVDVLAAGRDAGGRRLPSNAWMALRRLGWTTTVPEGVKVNDRIVRMALEQAGRVLRSVKWRADLTAGILSTWPADPGQRTRAEWEQVRAVGPGRAGVAVQCDQGPDPAGRRASSPPTAVCRWMCSRWKACRGLRGCCCWPRVTGSRPPSNAATPTRAGRCYACSCRPGRIRVRIGTGRGWPARSTCHPRCPPRRCCTCPPSASPTGRCAPTWHTRTRCPRRAVPGTRSRWAWTGG